MHNALTDSGLQPWLIRHGIQRLIVSGIRTEQCCETTTPGASDLGLRSGLRHRGHVDVCDDSSA
ncbi:isochorismatase family protein [Chromobacterium haemolyticum]|uniref:isochorismatase family protein n=1 Tax=Chromobacterium haemolyticum TaxID=394935 RepID=UPI001F07DAA6|nr:isochorismatase family protein [Chromobacterium haemolyticum]